MTPESRAKEVVQEICKPLDGGRPYLETPHRKLMADLIASAIRSAENDKLEEAALAAEKAYGGPAHTYASENADIYRAQDAACARIAGHIRALKKD